MSSRRPLLLLALALLAPSCKGNVNDHAVLVSVTDRASVTASGLETNLPALAPSISADGRYVAFQSQGTNLVPGDTLGFEDIFRKDMVTGELVLVSANLAGGFADGNSSHPSISGDGRFVAFESRATDLVAGDTNGLSDVFVRDVLAGTTIRVSVISGAGGAQSTMSAIGLGCYEPVISADGTFVAFTSDATDLVPAVAVTLFNNNIYRHPNAPAGTTDLVSINTGGAEPDGNSGSPAISATGQFVAFQSTSTDVVSPAANGMQNIFVRDLTADSTEMFSISTAGVPTDAPCANPSVSGDGSRVAFDSAATTLAPDANPLSNDIFLRVRGGATTVISKNLLGVQAIGDCRLPAMSGDGRFVAYLSNAANLVPADSNGLPDIFWYDTATGLALRVSVGTYGAQSNDQTGTSSRPVISQDGRFVAFESKASNLVAGDGNDVQDVFVHGPMY